VVTGILGFSYMKMNIENFMKIASPPVICHLRGRINVRFSCRGILLGALSYEVMKNMLILIIFNKFKYLDVSMWFRSLIILSKFKYLRLSSL
jgi:hypothetical protein